MDRRPFLTAVTLAVTALIAPNSMSFKTTNEILGGFSLWPQQFTLDNYRKIFTDRTWYMGYVNSITYVVINTVISVLVALPAAYAFSRYRFLGDKHLFFWLLTNRMDATTRSAKLAGWRDAVRRTLSVP